MKILRWVLGAVVGLWALYGAFPLVLNVAHKLGKLPASPEGQKYLALMDATQWWQLGLWALMTLLLLVAAWRLFTGGKALMVFVLGALVNVVMWWFFHDMAAYKATFSAQELMFDYYIFCGEAVMAVLIWLTERRKAA